MRRGATRLVLLMGKYAIKVPNVCDGWRLFLRGLLANMQEAQWSRGWEQGGLCQVRWAIPGGWLLVMPRVRVMTREEFEEWAWSEEAGQTGYERWAEEHGLAKERMDLTPENFGWWEGNLVAIDYGS